MSRVMVAVYITFMAKQAKAYYWFQMQHNIVHAFFMFCLFSVKKLSEFLIKNSLSNC